MNTTITLSYETRIKLTRIKLDNKLKTLEEVILHLIDNK